MSPDPGVLGILLLSGEYERAHYAFMVATAAAAVGRRVVLFATNDGCHTLAADWSALRGPGRTAMDRDGEVRARGVAGLEELRMAATELGVWLGVCGSGLALSGVTAGELLPGVTVAGIPTFLAEVGAGQFMTL